MEDELCPNCSLPMMEEDGNLHCPNCGDDNHGEPELDSSDASEEQSLTDDPGAPDPNPPSWDDTPPLPTPPPPVEPAAPAPYIPPSQTPSQTSYSSTQAYPQTSTSEPTRSSYSQAESEPAESKNRSRRSSSKKREHKHGTPLVGLALMGVGIAMLITIIMEASAIKGGGTSLVGGAFGGQGIFFNAMIEDVVIFGILIYMIGNMISVMMMRSKRER